MITLYQMDVIKALKQMPDESIDMQITSPPYWGLRDYGEGVEVVWDERCDNCQEFKKDCRCENGYYQCDHEFVEFIDKKHSGSTKEEWVGDMSRGIRKTAGEWEIKSNFCKKCGAWKGQLGLEPDFNLYIKHLADVFDEVKRVLKKDGTCWINLGDTYASSPSGLTTEKAEEWDKKGDGMFGRLHNLHTADRTQETTPKQLSGIQPKCLCGIPERFMIEMINRGWILRNKIIWHKPNHMPTSVKDRFATSWEYLFFFSKSKKYYFDLDAVREKHKHGIGSQFNLRVRDVKRGYAEKSGQYKASDKEVEQYHGQQVVYNPKGKNPDDILVTPHHPKGDENRGMRLPPQPNQPNAFHPLGKNPSDFWDITTRGYPEAHFAVFPRALVKRPIKTTRKNAVIMDIFAGSGTTLEVARDLHRDSIGIEIKPEYCKLIKKRLYKGNVPLDKNEFKLIN